MCSLSKHVVILKCFNLIPLPWNFHSFLHFFSVIIFKIFIVHNANFLKSILYFLKNSQAIHDNFLPKNYHWITKFFLPSILSAGSSIRPDSHYYLRSEVDKNARQQRIRLDFRDKFLAKSITLHGWGVSRQGRPFQTWTGAL